MVNITLNNKIKILLVAGALGAGFYLPNLLKQTPNADLDLSSYCMLSSDVCEQQGVKLKLDTQRVTPLTPIKVDVFWPNAEAETLSISLQGKEMDMGVAKYQLEMIKPDVYQGEIILPVCAEQRMTWYGTVSDGSTDIKAALRMSAR
ncbi:hypothetical protein JCM19240_4789 [Vibrio maritimus]|uniref:Uncharacterized protein n=1 Tax=Vibrio maritimus TaxID=990268 RepID=A0A090TAT3_9VIBR|nr:hypothetical protein JCM19240_4789 [Vibrio maritimus]